MRITAVITARGGSKGVPRKNIAMLHGRTMLSYTAQAALAATRLDRIVVSTDDEEIATEAKRCKLEVPFMRPVELSQDTTPTLPVLQHAVRWMEEHGEQIDAICLLQPTHPFRTSQDIDCCIELLEHSGADAAVTVARVPDEYNPHWTYAMNENHEMRLTTGELVPIPRRQELPPAYHREGSVYVMRRDVLMKQNSLYGQRTVGFLVDATSRVNIDSIHDLDRAQRMLAAQSLSDNDLSNETQ